MGGWVEKDRRHYSDHRSIRTDKRHVMLPNSGIYRPEEVILIILCDLLTWWTRALNAATLPLADSSHGTIKQL